MVGGERPQPPRVLALLCRVAVRAAAPPANLRHRCRRRRARRWAAGSTRSATASACCCRGRLPARRTWCESLRAGTRCSPPPPAPTSAAAPGVWARGPGAARGRRSAERGGGMVPAGPWPCRPALPSPPCSSTKRTRSAHLLSMSAPRSYWELCEDLLQPGELAWLSGCDNPPVKVLMVVSGLIKRCVPAAGGAAM